MAITHTSFNGLAKYTITGLPDDVTKQELRALNRSIRCRGRLHPTKSGYTRHTNENGFTHDVFFSGIVFYNAFTKSQFHCVSGIIPAEERVSKDTLLTCGYFLRILKILGVAQETFFSNTTHYISVYLEISKRVSVWMDTAAFLARMKDLRLLWARYLATDDRPILLFRAPEDSKDPFGGIVDTIQIIPVDMSALNVSPMRYTGNDDPIYTPKCIAQEE